MKLEPNKRSKNEYMVTVTMQFSLFFTNKEVDDGIEIPHDVIVQGVNKCVENKEYDVQEDEC